MHLLSIKEVQARAILSQQYDDALNTQKKRAQIRPLDAFRDPERQAKIERSRLRKREARAAQVLLPAIRGHLVRVQLRREGPAKFIDPDRTGTLRRAKLRKTASKRRSVEEEAARKVAAVLKGHRVRARATTPLKIMRDRLRDVMRDAMRKPTPPRAKYTIRDDDGEERVSIFWSDVFVDSGLRCAVLREPAHEADSIPAGVAYPVEMVWM
jgi:hypothetical protein